MFLGPGQCSQTKKKGIIPGARQRLDSEGQVPDSFPVVLPPGFYTLGVITKKTASITRAIRRVGGNGLVYQGSRAQTLPCFLAMVVQKMASAPWTG